MAIYVRRSVVSAAQRLEALADSDDEADPLDLAEQKITDCLEAGDKAGMKFWRRVWVHLMTEKYAPGRIQIIEDDEAALPARIDRVPEIL